jgi:hypothetical protein
MPNGLTSRKQAEHRRTQDLQSRYAGVAKAGQDENADAFLNRVRSEREAEIGGHEQAHKSAAGRFGGSIVIERDANGVAFAGHVPISIPALNPASPEESLAAYQTIRFAALKPGKPSGQDMAVAAQAQALMGMAQVLMNRKQTLNGQSQSLPGV